MDIYDEKFVESLFSRMSKTYGITNYICSLGFTERWRRQCIQEINWQKDIQSGYDLMSGMGESWNLINRESKNTHKLTGVDISPEMNKQAKNKLDRYQSLSLNIKQENILENSLKSNSADYIVSTFGIKTFSKYQLDSLAKEIYRILKPNGQFSFIEISTPKNKLLQIPYIFYLMHVIPLIGKLFMGNSSDYKMLGLYCKNFMDCSRFKDQLEKEGLHVKQKEYFFGCATGVIGIKK